MDVVRTLLDDASVRERMQAAQELYVDPTAAAQICGFILADCGYLEPAAQATDTAPDDKCCRAFRPCRYDLLSYG